MNDGLPKKSRAMQQKINRDTTTSLSVHSQSVLASPVHRSDHSSAAWSRIWVDRFARSLEVVGGCNDALFQIR